MRVLLVAHRFPPDDLGGVERHVETAARGLRDAGHEVRVLAQRESDHVRLQPENKAMEPIRTTDVRIMGRVVGLFRSVS